MNREITNSISNQRDPDKSDISDPQVEPIQKKEIGGPKGPEPTRYGDWEKNGRCSDF